MDDFRQVQNRYAERLRTALSEATRRLAISGLEIRPIDPDALNSFRDHWRGHANRVPDWDWTSSDFREPKGINLAIWYGETLCGLASGKLTNSKVVRIDYVEGSPNPHPLKGKIIPIVLTCGEAYRILVGSKELRLYRVIQPLIPVYEKYGFELAPEYDRVHVMRRKVQ